MNRARKFYRSLSQRRYCPCLLTGVLLVATVFAHSASAPWSAVGPDGGDARSIAAIPGDPAHLFLGTTNSWIYESSDGGVSWHRLAKLESADDLVIDHIVVDAANPAILYAAAWTPSHPGGGLWVSHDGGKAWSESAGLSGQSIRAFVQAHSAPSTFFAGTLDGVFRSSNSGATWEQISPKGSREIHEIESLAIDPENPDIVYAGTWHLPWKTIDGGKTWHAIKKGMIDDSDVFSIVVDPEKPRVVFAERVQRHLQEREAQESCSARLREFPQQRAGPACCRTRTHRTACVVRRNNGRALQDNGRWQDLPAHDRARRDCERRVHVDFADSQHVLLATDRGGVLASMMGERPSRRRTQGISARKVDALLVDNRNPARHVCRCGERQDLRRRVCFDRHGGAAWQQVADGLEGRDVFALAQAKDGTVLAGTSHGIFALEPNAAVWEPMNLIESRFSGQPSKHDCESRKEAYATETHMEDKRIKREQVKAPALRLDEPGECAGSFRRCMAGFHQWAAFDQQRTRAPVGRVDR
jgi:photosystem II stability/assembly factor-like uncharacterized protein